MLAYLLCAIVCFFKCPRVQPRDQLSRGAHSSLHENSSLQSLALSRADTQTLSTSSVAAENSDIIPNPTETQASRHCGSSGGAHARSALSTLYILLLCNLPLFFSMVSLLCACSSDRYSRFPIFTLCACPHLKRGNTWRRAVSAMAALGSERTVREENGNSSIKDFERELPSDLEELRKIKHDLLVGDASFGYSYRRDFTAPSQARGRFRHTFW